MSLWVLFGCSDPEQRGQRGEQTLNPDGGAAALADAGADSGSGPASQGASCAQTGCDPNATCDDSDGDAVCSCGPGFTGNGTTCTDVDECEADNGGCDAHAMCVNRPGSRRCLCDETFSGDGLTCTGTDECADSELNTCDPNASCTDEIEGFACACGSGTTGDGFGCGDVDECADPDLFECAANTSCKNTFGGYACECGPGFTGTATDCNSLCQADSCPNDRLCRVLIGGTDCTADACAPGYVGDGTNCTAIAAGDDCAACDGQGTDDVSGGVCTGTPGAGTCTCADGYAGTFPDCEEIDECQTDNGGCGDAEHFRCTNLPGGYFCDCQPGWSGVACDQDVDECAAGTSLCHPNATCSNTDGGYTCACKAGYTGDGSVCRDVDECAEGTADCLDDGTARCVNTAGAFQCACRRGYTGDGVTACENLNECADPSLNDCDEDATCTDQSPSENPLGYDCACAPGLGGDGTSCADIDECNNAALHDCEANATCVNDPGGYHCECQDPFTGSPNACHCDLSGYWAMRQDVDTCWCNRDLVGVTVISFGSAETTAWELHRYDYDGDTIAVEKVGCGADTSPDFISPLFGETYSSYVPDATFFALELERGKDIEEPGIVPGSTFTTPDEAAIAGIDLGEDRECEDCWPAASTAINPVGGAAPAWVDTDGDGVPGLTLWPRVPSRRTRDDSDYYNYVPVNLDLDDNNEPTERAACVSAATRIITRLEADVDSCTRMVGEVFNLKTEGRVGRCALAPMVDWQDDLSCDAEDWDDLPECDPAAVQRLDEQDQSQTSTATFELVKIGGPDDDIDCQDVRAALPALARTTPTPIACDCP